MSPAATPVARVWRRVAAAVLTQPAAALSSSMTRSRLSPLRASSTVPNRLIPEPPPAVEVMSSRSVACAPQAYTRIPVVSVRVRPARLKRQTSLLAPGCSSMMVRLV